jgi:hypothetical protein
MGDGVVCIFHLEDDYESDYVHTRDGGSTMVSILFFPCTDIKFDVGELDIYTTLNQMKS